MSRLAANALRSPRSLASSISYSYLIATRVQHAPLSSSRHAASVATGQASSTAPGAGASLCWAAHAPTTKRRRGTSCDRCVMQERYGSRRERLRGRELFCDRRERGRARGRIRGRGLDELAEQGSRASQAGLHGAFGHAERCADLRGGERLPVEQLERGLQLERQALQRREHERLLGTLGDLRQRSRLEVVHRDGAEVDPFVAARVLVVLAQGVVGDREEERPKGSFAAEPRGRLEQRREGGLHEIVLELDRVAHLAAEE